ncbi:hypothetical protein J6590_042349 [Homalodisca vitripennis]|nr:hypothetical protein J6590_042349 [Homalodisca vitripennis]
MSSLNPNETSCFVMVLKNFGGRDEFFSGFRERDGRAAILSRMTMSPSSGPPTAPGTTTSDYCLRRAVIREYFAPRWRSARRLIFLHSQHVRVGVRLLKTAKKSTSNSSSPF